MINFSETKKKLLKNPEVAEEYEKHREEFEIARALIRARLKARMTQQEVAKKMHTSQAQVARLESGEHMPSLNSIFKYAKAIERDINLKIHA